MSAPALPNHIDVEPSFWPQQVNDVYNSLVEIARSYPEPLPERALTAAALAARIQSNPTAQEVLEASELFLDCQPQIGVAGRDNAEQRDQSLPLWWPLTWSNLTYKGMDNAWLQQREAGLLQTMRACRRQHDRQGLHAVVGAVREVRQARSLLQ
ncbi:MAG TPA: hypothetical protein VJP80_07965 [Candidatus Saccharimonadales bacterium]|nr:hypothetical protein [Candidatus Saccharimonadales bacterium]